MANLGSGRRTVLADLSAAAALGFEDAEQRRSSLGWPEDYLSARGLLAGEFNGKVPVRGEGD